MALAEVIGREGAARAPWHLEGSGFVLLFRLPRQINAERLSSDRAAQFQGGTSALVFADYERSPVGPHRELLYVPGRFGDGDGSHYSVTRGFASTAASVESGWATFGLPKEQARFSVTRQGRTVLVEVSLGARPVASIAVESGRFGLSTSTDLVPSAKRTIVQRLEGPALSMTPEGRGTIKRGRLVDIEVDGDLFPDLGAIRPKASVILENFHVVLPSPILGQPAAATARARLEASPAV